ncbi:MAG: hypothetical protein H0T62_13005 [Parachlamydiaceae bacterium]|nr:hypothetical protein [Parachlamydiaceae bacterium]
MRTIILSLIILLSADKYVYSDNQNQSIDDYANWITTLNPTYEVTQGNAYLLKKSERPLFVSIFGSCFGENPATTYIIPQPPVNHRYVDPFYATALTTPGPNNSTANIIYRLSDNEALVTIVSYPPKAAYFGYQSYVFTRNSNHYVGITPPYPRTKSPDPKRYEIFGSIGNDVNNMVVQNQYGAQPWDGTVVVYITTSNRNLARALTRKAESYGINKKSIYVEPIGSNVITGVTRSADDLTTLIRYAAPKSTSDANQWTDNLSKNVLVYKVTHSDSSVIRFGENAYTAHSINYNETHFSPNLKTALQQLSKLLQSYLEKMQSSTALARQSIIVTKDNLEGIPYKGLIGAYGIQYGLRCEGDNHSSNATITLKTLGAQETAFIVGVDHTVLNNSSYISIDIYDSINSSGVANSSQTNLKAVGFNKGNLTGSAKAVLEALGIKIPPSCVQLQKEIERLYVSPLTRNISNPTIAAASKYCIDLMGTSLIPAGYPISISERSYIVPNTTTGGNVNYMLYPIIIAAGQNFIIP